MIARPLADKTVLDCLASPHPDLIAYEAAVLILDVLATAGAEPDKWPPVRLKAAIQVKVREALYRYGRAFLDEKPAYLVDMVDLEMVEEIKLRETTRKREEGSS